MSEQRYPHLLELSTENEYPIGNRPLTTFGSGEGCDIALSGAGDGQLFQIEGADGKWFISPLARELNLSVEQKPVTDRAELHHLAVIQANKRVFVFMAREDANVGSTLSTNLFLISKIAEQTSLGSAASGQTMGFTMREADALLDEIVPLELPSEIKLPEQQLLIGREEGRVDIHLPDIRVSRTHAWILREGRKATITDLRSANGTFVDGKAIRRPTVIKEGDRIQIGPYNLIFRNRALYSVSHENNVQLVAHGLTRRVPDRKRRGQTKTILDDISLVVQPHEFVCILGPSGSGKTTLLSALSARVRPNKGRVLFNSDDLFANFDALKQSLAVVPQRDVLHDVLPVNVALWYTAKLRLPKDTSRDDIDARIDEMLETVNLTQHQFTQIHRLSGGQVKRASCINELICNPSLIFLDEVTSGLDEQSDCEMMRLFRTMADNGKTIVCVTHSLSFVEENCHLVVILGTGGVLAFVGSPSDAIKYFGIKRLGEVYQKLKERHPDTWKEKFRQSEYYQTYIAKRLPDEVSKEPPKAPNPFRHILAAGAFWRQFTLLTRRYLSIKWADKRSLTMSFGQCLFIAVMLAWLFGDISYRDKESSVDNEDVQEEALAYAKKVFFVETMNDLFEEDRDEIYRQQKELKRAILRAEQELKHASRTSKLLFMLCISSIWFGCNGAAKEIVKERSIFAKERDAGLRIISYYGSKILLLGVLAVMQASLLYFVVRHFTNLEGNPLEQWILLALVAITGIAIGLAISAISNSVDLAVTIVPIFLIPQIIFAGLIAPLFHGTERFSQICVTSYWSYQGLLRTLDERNIKTLKNAEILNLGASWTTAEVSLVLLGHIAICGATAILVLLLRDRKNDFRVMRFLRFKG
jgi:ABC-type multidrug transport system ATPase subunit